MGLAIDTVLWDVHNAATSAAGLTGATVTASGDPSSVRSFDSPAYCRLDSAFVQGSGTRQARLLSPRLHDNVTGFTWQSSETPTEFLFPSQIGQPMYSVDALTLQLDAAASSDTIAALSLYYSDLEGIDAKLRSWQDIKPHVVNLKSMEVDCTSSGTIGAWTDTVITTTENQLKADYHYALLGFEQNTAVCTIGLKGPATGNLRICVPGQTSTFPLTEWFIRMAEKHGRPYIPVFKSNDRGSTNISVAANTASVAVKVYAILAQLDN